MRYPAQYWAFPIAGVIVVVTVVVAGKVLSPAFISSALFGIAVATAIYLLVSSNAFDLVKELKRRRADVGAATIFRLSPGFVRAVTKIGDPQQPREGLMESYAAVTFGEEDLLIWRWYDAGMHLAASVPFFSVTAVRDGDADFGRTIDQAVEVTVQGNSKRPLMLSFPLVHVSGPIVRRASPKEFDALLISLLEKTRLKHVD